MSTVYLSLGSNMGDREKNLNNAIRLLEETEDVQVDIISKYIETDPVGYVAQDKFLNCALKISTQLSPSRILKICMNIEKKLKRMRTVKWGPRTIDIDILMYDDLVIDEENLVIPHPRMHHRLFVLECLNEIAPNAVHPSTGKKIKELYTEIVQNTTD
ncbi:MAG: 2-amino-4-hydroxy-6-hydroxymethyldihydropteridine diphosphokinase [Clostridia bacterium]|nr:2-amino-4-hydroxy-6-hydroxymethyldihydropteridine diphosphokinase [Clostridia bacterium]